MSKIAWSYDVRGIDGNGNAWSVLGSTEVAEDQGWMTVIENAIQDAFQQVTGGTAMYGCPGVGCRGPYKITHLSIEQPGHTANYAHVSLRQH